MVECLRMLPPEELTILRGHPNDTWRPATDHFRPAGEQYYPGTGEELTIDAVFLRWPIFVPQN